MAVRQYIGARYVPKFFEGVGGSSEWVGGVEYEPLTIVTYLGNSYTSKKTVPSTIGAPNNNLNYWVNTGNYNAQIEEYQEAVERALSELDKRTARKIFALEDYGGKVNDPNVDNTPALYDALKDATENGGIVQLKEGTYYFLTSLTVDFSLEAVELAGAFTSTTDRLTEGTVLRFDGTGTFITFTQRFWKCRIHDFDIYTPNAAVGVDCLGTVHLTQFNNVSFREATTTFMCRKYAYAYFNYCQFRPRENTTGARCLVISDPDDTEKTNEYLGLNCCVLDARSLSQSVGAPYNSKCIDIYGGIHIVAYFCDLIKGDIGIHVHAPKQCRYLNFYSCDIAACHTGVLAEMSGNSIRDFSMVNPVFTHAGVTDYGPTFTSDKFFDGKRLTGGSAIKMTIKLDGVSIVKDPNVTTTHDILIGNDALDYVHSTIDSGFTDLVMDLGTYFYPYEYAIDEDTTGSRDLNDFKSLGIVHRGFYANAPHNPGFACFLMNVAMPDGIIQTAFPFGSDTAAPKHRKFAYSTSTWGTWY